MAQRSAVLAVLVWWAALTVAPARETDERWLRRRVEEDRRHAHTAWRRIPWVSSLMEARRLSAREKAPVLLFAHDGNMETGRC